MFQPNHIKQARLLEKGVRKFLRYKEDTIAPARLEEIAALRERFSSAIRGGDRTEIEAAGKALTKACESSVPPVASPGLRENLEILFVAVVIAFGIRTYFLQPFKIPTGSMQPTLNGIIAQPQFEIIPPATLGAPPEIRLGDQPGFFQKALEFVWFGRNYVHAVAEQDDQIVGVLETTKVRFFTFTVLQMASGDHLSIYAPADKALGDLGLRTLTGVHPSRDGRVDPPIPVRENQLVAYGYVDTGDQVLVDKVSYHFRQPRRGEVFVFNTRGITGISSSPSFNPQAGSQHYIKRLVAVPGDHLEVREPELWINGQRATEPGTVRVMEGASDPSSTYNGYQDVSELRQGWPRYIREHTMGEHEYFAMGDNSFSSFDSRMWGTVPERNLVGPALVVYWPFGHHWGPID